jgi:hypothetical protein
MSAYLVARRTMTITFQINDICNSNSCMTEVTTISSLALVDNSNGNHGRLPDIAGVGAGVMKVARLEGLISLTY